MKRPSVFQPAHARGRVERERQYDAARGSAGARLYGAAWRRARDAHLHEHPLCEMCLEQGVTTAATVVDHSIAHRGDVLLFWDRSKWRSCCKAHHDRDAQIRDRASDR